MSLIAKNCFSNVGYKRLLSCSYICNELRLKFPYYTCSSNSKQVPLKPIKFETLDHREFSLISDINYKVFQMKLKFSNLYKNVDGYMPIASSAKYKYHGFLWYKTLEEIDLNYFFTALNLEDTFNSRFRIIELHVWMLLYVLPRKNRRNNLMRIGVMEALWEDTEARAKSMASKYKNYKDDIKHYFNQFKIALLLYDYGYHQSDAQLSSSLWYSFYERKIDDPRYLEVLVSYVRKQVDHLRSFNFEESPKETEKKLWLPLRPHVEAALKK